ncbi:hypothetical protein GON03_19280 [Nocardioides sp. MAH-18]|uniref:Lipoprotein n=1 Tax=Nocardioides agri TaxID=2682843 RepID=A0A6L6XW91_9ACTN|nr:MULTISPECIES: hypothetical protein [unclassified Nocardioides]MBA2952162.1 hypothetical protein [Nocardioides sp. CGMCC 1.13656]MVQ51328.1 hypothetical protein [Nocardioides sp. MAH-18]
MKLATIALTPVLAVLAVGCSSGGEDDGGGEYGAKDVCQQFVEDRLKSPGTADFSSEVASENSDGSWTVRGDVDSENGFGALLRNSYECTVRYQPSTERWKLEDMQTTEN